MPVPAMLVVVNIVAGQGNYLVGLGCLDDSYFEGWCVGRDLVEISTRSRPAPPSPQSLIEISNLYRPISTESWSRSRPDLEGVGRDLVEISTRSRPSPLRDVIEISTRYRAGVESISRRDPDTIVRGMRSIIMCMCWLVRGRWEAREGIAVYRCAGCISSLQDFTLI